MSQNEPSAGAMRAARAIYEASKDETPMSHEAAELLVAAIIDRETGLKELTEACKEVADDIDDFGNTFCEEPMLPSDDDDDEATIEIVPSILGGWLARLQSALKLAQGGPK